MHTLALRFHGPGDLRLETVDLRRAEAGDVVIEVEASGVCGSDLHILRGTARTRSTPLTLGHEIAGRVAASHTPGWQDGAEVVVTAGVSCGTCRRCREGRETLCEQLLLTGIDFDGGLAQHVVVPGSALLTRPPALTPDVAATAADAGNTAYHAVTCRGQVRPGHAVLIIGAGGLGSYGLQIAKLRGAAPVLVADIDPAALERARQLGADEVVLVEEGMSLGRQVKLATDGGVDVAIEFVGTPSAVDAAVKSLRPGGTAVAVGVGVEPLHTLPPVLWATNEYQLLGSFGGHRTDLIELLRWLEEGLVRPPVIDHVDLDGAVDQIMSAAEHGYRGGRRLVVMPGQTR